MSVDHLPVLKAWAESLGGISYPLLSDFWPHGKASREWGVLREDEGSTERALFVIGGDGIVRFADVHDIDDQPDNAEIFAVLEGLEPALAARMHAEDAAAGEERPGAAASEIVMFCTPWCPDCRQAREWLTAHGIAYQEIDVSRDSDARNRAAEHNEGRLHTPTFEIGDKVCVDFRPERLSELLGID